MAVSTGKVRSPYKIRHGDRHRSRLRPSFGTVRVPVKQEIVGGFSRDGSRGWSGKWSKRGFGHWFGGRTLRERFRWVVGVSDRGSSLGSSLGSLSGFGSRARLTLLSGKLNGHLGFKSGYWAGGFGMEFFEV